MEHTKYKIKEFLRPLINNVDNSNDNQNNSNVYKLRKSKSKPQLYFSKNVQDKDLLDDFRPPPLPTRPRTFTYSYGSKSTPNSNPNSNSSLNLNLNPNLNLYTNSRPSSRPSSPSSSQTTLSNVTVKKELHKQKSLGDLNLLSKNKTNNSPLGLTHFKSASTMLDNLSTQENSKNSKFIGRRSIKLIEGIEHGKVFKLAALYEERLKGVQLLHSIK
ncbi:uncharacterized protein ASCRUDRAFT_77842 [Ascoidea rubescens DSM 1968]|uniref:Uncharacterized protein n=1 Tax=Ascoidea rubescens DSM 1968 TaxID=1344418 RepID=A0A1D2VAB9_9ASCO|nr:hypothetical protein ASCRUDRAFT_77842 [Ascoidea rubescens DSM 1968]ODV58608.1 hypothetical protein ASCRUDRAFT_77842 [Ascoidea rubescens DSM 1968]